MLVRKTMLPQCAWYMSSISFLTDYHPFMIQKLDNKTLQRLETAVAKSEYSQGKKLKVVTKVRFVSLGLIFFGKCTSAQLTDRT